LSFEIVIEILQPATNPLVTFFQNSIMVEL